jgi:Trk-type K+ transport system membrane component
MTLIIFAALVFNNYADRLKTIAFMKNNLHNESSSTLLSRISSIIFGIIFSAYMGMYFVYLYRLIKTDPSSLNAKLRFCTEAIVVVQIWSLVTVFMVSYNTENKTLQFVSHNGIVNLYLTSVSYFFEGHTEDDFSYENDLPTVRSETQDDYNFAMASTIEIGST